MTLITTIQRFVGVSTDTKFTTPPPGSTFYETDTGATYVFDGSAWSLQFDGTPLKASKTITFDGTAGLGGSGTPVDWFSVTGQVLVLYIAGTCTADLTESGATATIALGVTGATTQFISATDAVNIDDGELWVDTTPDSNAVAIPAACKDILITDDIISTIATANVTGGTLRIDVWWQPMSEDGLVAAA